MRTLRDTSNPFNTPEEVFRKMFRFPRNLAHEYFLQMHQFLEDGQRSTRIPAVTQFFIALHFYAHGSYQKSIGKDRDHSVCQSSVSRCLHRVTNTIVNHLAPRFIKFPQTIDEITDVKNGFFDKFGFPGVVGAIDGTHIAIVCPPLGGRPPGNVYLNRKNFYSINAQIICDSALKILSLNCRYPGSVHDAAIWQMSAIFRHLRNNYRNGDRTSWLLGDAGYPLQPFLLLPIAGVNPETPQGRYSQAHIRARNTVERCIGVVKGTFRCLLKDRTLHYKPAFAAKLIIACATLHNILKRANVENELEDHDDPDNDHDNVDFADLYQEGINTRNLVIRNYFTD
ncbi:hypothetical protein Zmor_006120 [Zophobas morio]|uniref:DDE Tnp4 domain-containing protein n=1 Tax=Zophobas morio TaxID=2755281 RepID=A0AA38MN26_9CUCU|nr:hypothetical protein Zmor_006120 [Zophobas morio]